MIKKITKIGIIAGQGTLPDELIKACIKQKTEFFTIAINGFANSELIKDHPHSYVELGEIGKALKILKKEKIKDLVLIGKISRPDFKKMKMDFKALFWFLKLLKNKLFGDNHLIEIFISLFKKEGFNIHGVDDFVKEIIVKKGVLGKIKPSKKQAEDIELGKKVAKEIGKLDIGQAIIIQNKNIIGAEAQEGTDGLIKRCKELQKSGPGGILVKMKKPQQDRRIDLPTIGINTIKNIQKSGLSGIALEAENSLITEFDKTINAANKSGIFIVGI